MFQKAPQCVFRYIRSTLSSNFLAWFKHLAASECVGVILSSSSSFSSSGTWFFSPQISVMLCCAWGDGIISCHVIFKTTRRLAVFEIFLGAASHWLNFLCSDHISSVVSSTLLGQKQLAVRVESVDSYDSARKWMTSKSEFMYLRAWLQLLNQSSNHFLLELLLYCLNYTLLGWWCFTGNKLDADVP